MSEQDERLTGSAATDPRSELRSSWEPELIVDRVSEAAWRGWTGVVRTGRAQGWRFVAVGIAVGAVPVFVARLVVSAGVRSDLWWLRVAAVSAALLLLVAVVTTMLRWYARHQASAEDPFPLLTAIVLFVVAAGLSVVVFAGVAMLAWQAGWASPAAGSREPDYVLVERGYLWTLVDAVPLLAIPSRLGWADPLPLTGAAAGIVLLAYKIVLLVPLIRVVQAAYGAVKARWMRAYERRQHTVELVEQDLREWPNWTGTPPLMPDPHLRPWHTASVLRLSATPVRRRTGSPVSLSGTGQLLIAAVSVAAVIAASQVVRVSGLLPSGLADRVGTVVAAALPWLVAAALAYRWFCIIPRHGEDLIGGSMPTLLLVCAAWIAQITAAAAALLYLLVRTGVATLTPVPSSADGGLAALEVLAWQVTAALPGPDIPDTLDWARPGQAGGVAAAGVEILLLLSIVILLGFPIGRALWVWSQHAGHDWQDPMAEDGPAGERALTEAVARLRAAKRGVEDLRASTETTTDWRWVQGHLTYPWVDQGDWLYRRGGVLDRFLPFQRKQLATITRLQRDLVGLQDAHTALVASRVDELLVEAFDAAATAVRRYFLALNEQRQASVASVGWRLRPRLRDADGPVPLNSIARRAEEAVKGFAALTHPRVGTSAGWRDAPLDELVHLARAVPVNELLAEMTSTQVRQRWDFDPRLRIVLAAVARRPADDVARFATGLAAAELAEARQAWQTGMPATGQLLDLVRRQGTMRIVAVVVALNSLSQDRTVGCVHGLVWPYKVRIRPAGQVVELVIALHDAGCDGVADEILDGWIRSARDASDLAARFRAAGRDDRGGPAR